jgi:hypothetical protein
LAAYLGINIIFGIIYALITGWSTLTQNPLSILGLLVLSIFYLPSYLISAIIGSGGDLGLILLAIGAIVASLIAAVLSGYFGESKGASFGGWGLTIITAYIIVIIIGFIAFPVLKALFEDTSGLFMYIFNTLEGEEGLNVIEAHILFGGASPGLAEIIRYQAILENLGGIPAVEDLLNMYEFFFGWNDIESLNYSFIFKQLSDAEIPVLTQVLLLNTVEPATFDLNTALLAVNIFKDQYHPPSPGSLSILAYVSITAAINAVLYGMFALGARRAAFY